MRNLGVGRAGWLWLCLVGLVFWAGCGSEPETQEPEPSQTTGYEFSPPSQQMQVSGLMATIPERKIHATLEPKLPKFQRCFFHGSEDVEFIGGHFRFYFRVNLQGQVEWVYPQESSVGHRGTERCLLDEAKKTRFPEPKGGDVAELAWGFELEPAGDVRAPVVWDAGRVASVVAEQRASVEACGSGSYQVTAYVAPGGSVMAAGAAADSIEAAEAIDCVVDAVKGWTMPDPGSYAAKVSFEL
ncbi:MAG: AgmX/PglI C-terminal domain-containing protein [Myxococcales bacterium]|nr:AgmX/PglI C-terminal domain-containing protein [Myxococcales bacterium]